MPRLKPTEDELKERRARAVALTKFMKDNKFTEVKLAEATGVSRRSIQMMKSGSVTPHPATLHKLASLVAKHRKGKASRIERLVVRSGRVRCGQAWHGKVRHKSIREVDMAKGSATAVNEPTNGAAEAIETGLPYIVHVTIEGSADLLLHAWNVEAVEEKANSKKGSAAKKTDNLESYVRRDEHGVICIPSEYLRMSIVNAAKFRQDPRSPRKSAMDLYKAALVSLKPLAPITTVTGELPKVWDYEHRCRVQVQRNGITRCRPAFKEGWKVEVPLLCNLPEYISASDLNEVVASAGRLIGVGDFRPSYGRFQVVRFEVQKD